MKFTTQQLRSLGSEENRGKQLIKVTKIAIDSRQNHGIKFLSLFWL